MIPIKLDKIDIAILQILTELKQDQEITTTQLAKKVFNLVDKQYERNRDKQNDLVAKDRFVRDRMNLRLCKCGLVANFQIEDTNYYKIVSECCEIINVRTVPSKKSRKKGKLIKVLSIETEEESMMFPLDPAT